MVSEEGIQGAAVMNLATAPAAGRGGVTGVTGAPVAGGLAASSYAQEGLAEVDFGEDEPALVPPSDEEQCRLGPDPDCGPPDGEDAWMAEVPADLLHEILDAMAADEPPEVLRPGLWPRDTGDGAGFAAGGVADRLAPSPALAGFTNDAWCDGLGSLTDDELIGVMRAWHRLQSWGCAGELAAVAELAARRAAAVEAGADPYLIEHVDDEIAAPLTLTNRAAGNLLDFAASLRRLPLTSAALAAGEIDRVKALIITDELSHLDTAHAAAVERAIVGKAAGQTSGQVRASARRAVIAADPAAARKRKEAAQREARVERWDEPDGTASLAGRDLPPAGVLAADHNVSALARALKAAGGQGTMDQLRAQAFLMLLTGEPIETLLATHRDQTSGAPSPEPADPAGAPGPPGNDPGDGSGVPRAAGPSAAAGPADGTQAPSPTRPSSTGDPARDSQAPSSTGPSSTADPAGGTQAPTATGPSNITDGDRPRFLDVGLPGLATGGAGLAGLAGRINLTMPVTTWLGLSDAPGDASGYGPLDSIDSRDLAAVLAKHPLTRWCLTLTDSHGRPVAHGCARKGSHPPRGSPGGCSPPANLLARAGVWLAGIALEWLETGDCTHRRETESYRPPPSLQHLLSVRQPTCSFPGCRRPATQSDLDHTIAFDKGGRTCECNLAPLCRAHHQAKQVQGWHLEQPEPGILIWRLPHGRTYRTGT
jgi:hypothetical protein